MIITIDGPVASGKTTVGRTLAAKLGYDYLYSGLLYRALAYLLVEKEQIALADLPTVDVQIVEQRGKLHHFAYHFKAGGENMIFVDDVALDEKLLMQPAIDTAASLLGLNAAVRYLLTEKQRLFALDRNVIVDGRDAGITVFPEAQYKFFLTASVEVRAQRYLARQKKEGQVESSLQEAQAIITERDARDNKWLSASIALPDMIVIDTSGMTQDQVVAMLLAIVMQHKKSNAA